MFENLKRIFKSNIEYICLNQLEDYLCGTEKIENMTECWLTPFYITSEITYEFYYLKLVVYRNVPFDEYFKNKVNCSTTVSDNKYSEKCYINIDDDTSQNEIIEAFINYIEYIKQNEEIVQTAIELTGTFDIGNIYFEYI